MNKNYLIIAVILAIVAVGGVYFLQKRSSNLEIQTTNDTATEVIITETTPESEVDSPVVNQVTGVNNPEPAGTVNYENSGFTPATISVKVNSVVQWMNNSDKMMWVASAVHPTHDVYPEFDQLKSVGKGEVYRFTFTKVGSWKYHNHLNPTETGTVEITP